MRKRAEVAESFENLSFMEGEIHVWRIHLDRGTRQVKEIFEWLSPDEKHRAVSFRVPADRDRCVVARGSVRRILSRYLRVRPEQVCFSYHRYGKPSLDDSSSTLRFNVTHSQGLAFLAIAKGREVGIDLEFIDRNFAFMKTARRVFSSDEYSRLEALDQVLRADAFFRCWSRQEALFKAIGTGLSERSSERDTSRIWTLEDLHVGPTYKAAVAVEGSLSSITLRSEDWQI